MTINGVEIIYSATLIPFVLSRVPQIIKLHKRKSSGDISVVQYWAVVITSIISIFYGLYKDSFSIVVANSINAVICSVIVFQYYKYKKENK